MQIIHSFSHFTLSRVTKSCQKLQLKCNANITWYNILCSWPSAYLCYKYVKTESVGWIVGFDPRFDPLQCWGGGYRVQQNLRGSIIDNHGWSQKVIVNIAFIILSEKEEGDADYTRWRQIMILLDLLCYAIILWPLYWSIKHLEQVNFKQISGWSIKTKFLVVTNRWKSSAESRKIGFISKLLYYVCSLHLFHTNSRLYSTYNTASTFDVGW